MMALAGEQATRRHLRLVDLTEARAPLLTGANTPAGSLSGGGGVRFVESLLECQRRMFHQERALSSDKTAELFNSPAQPFRQACVLQRGIVVGNQIINQSGG